MSLYGALQAMNPGEGVEYGAFTPTVFATLVTCSRLGYVRFAIALPSAAPTLLHMWDTVTSLRSNGDNTFGVEHKRPTAAGDVTPINATTFRAVAWVAIGDLIR